MTKQLSIREMVDEKVAKLRSVDNLSPQEIAQESIELSSLLASVNVEIVDRRMNYAEKFRDLLIEHGTAPKAKIYAEASPEHRAVLEAEAYSKSLIEIIRTTKRATALAESELKESKY